MGGHDLSPVEDLTNALTANHGNPVLIISYIYTPLIFHHILITLLCPRHRVHVIFQDNSSLVAAETLFGTISSMVYYAMCET